MGALPFLHGYEMIDFDITKYPVFNYVAYFFIVLAGKDLLKEGFKEGESPLKLPSIILAIALITLTTISTLNRMGVIKFALDYPPAIDWVLYIVCGLFLIIGIFILFSEGE